MSKIKVSQSAVLARIRRVLAREDDCRIVKNRHGPYSDNLSEWVIINAQKHCHGGFDDPESYARDRGVLKDFEEMVPE
jgi:hypothetical protein